MGIDPAVAPIPVRPAVHYTMGGILIDIHTATPLAGPLCGRRMFERRHPRRQPARIELARGALCVRPRRRRRSRRSSRRARLRRAPASSSIRRRRSAVKALALRDQKGGGERHAVLRNEMARHDGERVRHLSHGARDAGDLRQACGTEAALPRHHPGRPLRRLEHRLDFGDRTRLSARRRRGDGAQSRSSSARVARRASAARRLREPRRRQFPRPQPRPLSRGRGARDLLWAREDHQIAARPSAPTARLAKRWRAKEDAAHA